MTPNDPYFFAHTQTDRAEVGTIESANQSQGFLLWDPLLQFSFSLQQHFFFVLFALAWCVSTRKEELNDLRKRTFLKEQTAFDKHKHTQSTLGF